MGGTQCSGVLKPRGARCGTAVYADERGSLRAAVVSGFRGMADTALLTEQYFARGCIGAECGDGGGKEPYTDSGPYRD